MSREGTHRGPPELHQSAQGSPVDGPCPTTGRVLRVLLPAALGGAGLLTGTGYVTVLVLWYMTAVGMPGGTRMRQAVYALLTLFALNASVLTVLAVLDLRCSAPLLAATYVTALTGIRLVRHVPAAPTSWLDRHDAWALGLAGLTLLLLLPPLVRASPGQAMTLLSQTTDGANHVHLVVATARRGGYVNLDPVAGLHQGTEHYPGGWAGNVWILSRVATGSSVGPVSTVRWVGAVALASYVLLVFLAARLALALAAALKPQRSHRHDALTTGLVGLSTTLGFALILLNLASLTQVVAVSALLGALVVLTEECAPRAAHLVLAAAAIMLAQTWYLLAPALAAVVLAEFLHRPPQRTTLALYALTVGPITAYPLLTGPHSQHVGASGFQLLPGVLGVLGLLGASAIAMARLALTERVAQPLARATLGAFVATLLLVCGLLAVRPTGVVGPSYYAGKVLLVLLLLGGIAAAGAVVAQGNRTSVASTWRFAPLLIVAGIGLGTWSTMHDVLPPRAAHTQGHLDPQQLDALVDRHPHGLPHDTDAWVLDGCEGQLDPLESQWMYSLSLTWTSARSRDFQRYTDGVIDGTDLIASRLHDPGVRRLELVESRRCQSAKIAELARLQKVVLVRVRG